MPAAVTLVKRPEFSLHAWTCHGGGTGWSDPEHPVDARLVLVRAGRFRRHSRSGRVDLDRTVGYLGAPGEEERFAHPHGGDVCTSLQLAEQYWRELVGDPARVHRGTFYVDAEVELGHRMLLATDPADAEGVLAERLVRLVAAALRRSTDRRMPVTDRTTPADQRLVQQARAAIHDDHPAAGGLFALAAFLGASPYRLSRAFSRELGVSMTRYRNRVRVGRALDGLRAGDTTVADLAARLGFADQAHLTRTLHEHVGHPPTAVRRMLAPPSTQVQARQ
ncbi:AraC family transcriptional regulator [Mycolicibacterium pyrenivorans]|uniref:AraC family transcriptional regulator n=1 Tax=Mycolicibacterium pyrenivorans TaxID=187102 RepID=UPI0021F31D07|nr:AraC family transcriptional regulator [Mycolicibacterium pyrenivorans]MCV7154085.1 helix-turn-helix transcriptional regulator [Mycolicibacterium pyrenivorans]